jgi:hypothetical protein
MLVRMKCKGEVADNARIRVHVFARFIPEASTYIRQVSILFTSTSKVKTRVEIWMGAMVGVYIT